ncbi:unnamed protein product [Notodromas monacha]|uniref:Uncharacterized protein n=1 Tax=Notodromas monacha TaxID=399045 RepID=A0A7R9G953_9CRUS|nr:unnamed protein product [Notodromas monacha]CAG0912247.1 unnamed protein product [Notodromas monacha]
MLSAIALFVLICGPMIATCEFPQEPRMQRQMDGTPATDPERVLAKKIMPSDSKAYGFFKSAPTLPLSRDEVPQQVGISDVFWDVGRFLDKYRAYISNAGEKDQEIPEIPSNPADYLDTGGDEGSFVQARSRVYHPTPYRYNLLKFKPDDPSEYSSSEQRRRFGFGLGKKR